MTSAALISLRETLETSLIVGLLITVLNRMNQKKEQRFVWAGVAAGAVCSVAVAVLFQRSAASLVNDAKELYEGIMLLAAAGLLTWMIFWMMRMGHRAKVSIEQKVHMHAMHHSSIGIFLLAFTTTAREGTEMAIFLYAAFLSAQSNLHHFAGALTGMVGAILLSLAVFRGSRRFPLQYFFTVTSILLLLFAAGLAAHAVEALQEAHVLMLGTTALWHSDWLLREDSGIGSIAASMLGYSDAPNRLQAAAYVVYLMGTIVAWRTIKRVV